MSISSPPFLVTIKPPICAKKSNIYNKKVAFFSKFVHIVVVDVSNSPVLNRCEDEDRPQLAGPRCSSSTHSRSRTSLCMAQEGALKRPVQCRCNGQSTCDGRVPFSRSLTHPRHRLKHKRHTVSRRTRSHCH